MAGVAGFEPAHGDTKNRCLTAWLHPNTDRDLKTRQIIIEKQPSNYQIFAIST